MADLNDRGQIILIAGFALAVIFVALALVVNSAIFTENLATRGETTGGSDALIERHQVEESVTTIVENVNNDSTDPATEIERSVENLSLQSSAQNAQSGRITTVQIDPESKVARLYQENDSRGYVNATGVVDWTLATDADRIRTVKFNVTTANLAVVNKSERGQAFNFFINDSSNTWTMSVYDSYPAGGQYNVTVTENGIEEGTCSVSSTSFIDIEVKSGEVEANGNPCITSGGYPGYSNNTTRFENGDEATGNYSILIEEPDRIESDNFNETGSPKADVWIEELEVTYRHETTQIQYVTNFTVESEGS
jgi:hypothetical protein